MKYRASIILVQLLASACALPEVQPSEHASDAGEPQAHRIRDAGAQADAAAAREDPADDDDKSRAPQPSNNMPASDSGAARDMPTAPPSAPSCPVELTAREAPQTIWMLVDGSGSMVDPLDDKSRWLALREALLDNTAGVVKALELVHWGLALYDGPLPGGSAIPLPDGGVAMSSAPAATTCPRVIYVDPQPASFAAINAAYPLDPLGGSTPTHSALRALSDKIMKAPMSAASGRTSVVLATDGAPNDFCADGGSFEPVDRRPDVITAVQQLAQSGIKTYVISLAGADQMLGDHLQQVAQAGGSGQPAFVPASRTELIDTLREIATVPPSCEVLLARPVDPLRACDGTVNLTGKPLTCNAADGFSLRDEKILRLTGSACTQFQASPDTLDISYPCDALR